MPIPLARNSSTMSNKSSEHAHYCLVPDLRWETFSLPPFTVMYNVCSRVFVDAHYQFRKLPSISVFLRFCLFVFKIVNES